MTSDAFKREFAIVRLADILTSGTLISDLIYVPSVF